MSVSNSATIHNNARVRLSSAYWQYFMENWLTQLLRYYRSPTEAAF